ncbi:MAG: hypothetical protein NTY86_02895, partial [Deltaproteobacteria bacterium]|nr:hypothetical protein [Deltaproteobacteria bacterium]
MILPILTVLVAVLGLGVAYQTYRLNYAQSNPERRACAKALDVENSFYAVGEQHVAEVFGVPNLPVRLEPHEAFATSKLQKEIEEFGELANMSMNKNLQDAARKMRIGWTRFKSIDPPSKKDSGDVYKQKALARIASIVEFYTGVKQAKIECGLQHE